MNSHHFLLAVIFLLAVGCDRVQENLPKVKSPIKDISHSGVSSGEQVSKKSYLNKSGAHSVKKAVRLGKAFEKS